MTPDELLAIGEQLRAIREERGYSVEQVASSTRIRAKFLANIEAGEVDTSLSEMQWRGFLRNYAAFLRLDLDALLWAYRQRPQEKPKGLFGRAKTKTAEIAPIPPYVPAPPQPPAPRVPLSPTYSSGETLPRGPRWGLMLLTLGVALILLLGGGFVASNLLENATDSIETNPIAPLAIQGAETSTPTLDSSAPVDPKWGGGATSDPASPSPTAGGIIVALPQTTPNQPNLANAETVEIVIQANQRSWVRVEVDGQVEYENIMRPDTLLQYQADRSIALRTSNAGGLEVMVNNQPLGPLGGRGELYENIFAVGEPITLPPTPTPSAPIALETIDSSRPEPILPVVPDNMQPTLTPAPTLDPSLPTPLPTFGPIVTEQAPGG